MGLNLPSQNLYLIITQAHWFDAVLPYYCYRPERILSLREANGPLTL